MRIQLSDHFNYSKLIRFVLPSVLMILCMSVYNIVDGFFVSNFVSKTSFAAVNLMTPIIMVISSIGYMIGTGGSAVVSKTMGEDKHELANGYFSMLISAAFIFSAVLSIIGFIFTPQIAVLLGAEGELLRDCTTYGRILFCSTPLFVLQQTFQSFYVAAEKPGLSLIVSVIAGITNIALDFLFIVPLNMGIAGASLATAIAQTIGGVFPVIYFARKNNSLLRLSFKFKMSWKALGAACANGSSEMVSNLSVNLVNILYNFQLMKFAGENGIAAYGVIMYVAIIFNAIFMGYSIGSAPIVSFHYGAKDTGELKNLFKKSLVIIILSDVFITAMAIIFAKPLAMIFTSYDPNLLEMTVRGSRIYGLAYLFMGVNVWGSSFFTALNNGKVSALISFLRTFLFQIAAVLILPLIWKLDGVWAAITVAEMLAVIVTVTFLAVKKKHYHY